MDTRTPPTIDDVVAVVPALVRALGIIVDQMDQLIHLSCHATNLPEETADAMSDIGHALMEHSRAIMREANARKRSGPGSAPLLRRGEGSMADPPPARSADADFSAESDPPPAAPA